MDEQKQTSAEEVQAKRESDLKKEQVALAAMGMQSRPSVAEDLKALNLPEGTDGYHLVCFEADDHLRMMWNGMTGDRMRIVFQILVERYIRIDDRLADVMTDTIRCTREKVQEELIAQSPELASGFRETVEAATLNFVTRVVLSDRTFASKLIDHVMKTARQMKEIEKANKRHEEAKLAELSGHPTGESMPNPEADASLSKQSEAPKQEPEAEVSPNA